MLPGTHRTERDKTRQGGNFYIRWTAWRGKDAPVLATFRGVTRAEAFAAEKAGAEELARRYADLRTGHTPKTTLAGLLDAYQRTSEFKRCAESTQRERSRVLERMKDDMLTVDGRPRSLGLFPVAALVLKRARGIFSRWRDDQADQRGPRAADYRVQTLKRCLNLAVRAGDAPANPVADLEMLPGADRSDLIWEESHIKLFRKRVRDKIDKIWMTIPVDHPQRVARIMKLCATRDALILALNNGMRREDLSALSERECTSVAFAYVARKGARRARTAGKKRRTTIVPILPEAARVLAYRREAHGAESPWIIVSSRGGKYTPNTLGENVNSFARKAGIERHLHDAKGTFCTRVKLADPTLTKEEVAEMVDWEPSAVEEIWRRYVSGDAIARAMLERLDAKSKTG